MTQELYLNSVSFDEDQSLLLYLTCPQIQNSEIVITNSMLLTQFFKTLFNEKSIISTLSTLQDQQQITTNLTQYFEKNTIVHEDLAKLILNNSAIHPQICLFQQLLSQSHSRKLLNFILKNSKFSLIQTCPYKPPANNQWLAKSPLLHLAVARGFLEVLDKFDRFYSKRNIQIAWNDKADFEYQGQIFKSVTPLVLAVAFEEEYCIQFLVNKLQLDTKPTSTSNSLQYLSTSNLGNILHIAINLNNFKTFVLLMQLLHKKIIKQLLIQEDNEYLTPIMLICNQNKKHFLNVLQKEYQDLFLWKNNKLQTAKDFAAKYPELEESLLPIKQTSLQTLVQRIFIQISQNYPCYFQKFTLKSFENLVLCGGGNKGIAYFGALKFFEENQHRFKRISGTSAGGITSALLAVGYTWNEINDNFIQQKDILDYTEPLKQFYKEQNEQLKEVLKIIGVDLNFSNIIDQLKKEFAQTQQEFSKIYNESWFSFSKYSNFFEVAKQIIGNNNVMKLFKQLMQIIGSQRGCCKGETFRKWIEKMIYQKTGIQYCTFGELRELIKQHPDKYSHLYICSTKLSSGYNFATSFTTITESQTRITIFNTEDFVYDNIIISDSIRATMSLPIVYVPHQMHYKNQNGERELLLTNNNKPVEYIDGGLIRNFPINIFDKVRYVKKEEETALEPDLPCYNEKTLGIRFFYDCKIF